MNEELKILAEEELATEAYASEMADLDAQYYDWLLNDWIEEFRQSFFAEHGRMPTREEEETALTIKSAPPDESSDDDLPF